MRNIKTRLISYYDMRQSASCVLTFKSWLFILWQNGEIKENTGKRRPNVFLFFCEGSRNTYTSRSVVYF